MRRRARGVIGALAAMTMVVAACGGDDDDGAAATTAAAAETTVAATTTAASSDTTTGGSTADSTAGTEGDTPAAGEPEKCASPPSDLKGIKVGILHSLSGTMSISEVSVRDAELLAIEEINAAGGVLGKQLEAGRRGRRVRLADLRREGQEAARPRQGRGRLRRLDLGQPQGDAAGVRGPQRAALLPGPVRGPRGVAEHLLHRRDDEPADHPGARLPARSRARRRSSCSAPTTSSRARPTRSSRPTPRPTGGEIVGEEYTPLGDTEYATIVIKIKDAKPDIVFNTLNGDSNVAFFKQFKARANTPDQIQTVSVSVAEEEVRGIGVENIAGHLDGLELLPDDRHAEEREVRRGLQGQVRRRARDRRPDRGRLLRRLPLGRIGREGGLDRRRRDQGGGEEPGPSRRPRARSQVSDENQHISKTVRIGKVNADGLIDEVWARTGRSSPIRT